MDMCSQSVGLRVASVLFGLMCLGHVVRLVKGWDVQIGSHHFSHMLSVIGVVVGAALCVWLWRLAGPCCVKAGETPTAPPPAK
jgi:hypothetical protein